MRLIFFFGGLVLLMIIPFYAAYGEGSASAQSGAPTAKSGKQGMSVQRKADKKKMPDLTHLTAFVDKLPYEESNKQSIWLDPTLKKAVGITFGRKYTDRIYKEWVQTRELVEETLYRKGNILYTTAAKAHAANRNYTTIFIYLGSGPKDPLANTIQACFREFGADERMHAYWLATGLPPREIPSEAGALGCNADGLILLKKYGSLKWDIPVPESN